LLAMQITILAGLVFASSDALKTKSPVENVVHLLEDLKLKIEKDGEAELKVYDKFGCWCVKTSERKAVAIHDAKDELRRLGSKILELKGEVSELTLGIESDTVDAEDNEKEQKEATEIRQEENALFTAEDAEAKQAIAAMDKTFTILGTGASLLQGKAESMQMQLQKQLATLPENVILRVSGNTMSLLRQAQKDLAHKGQYKPSYQSLEKILKALDEEIKSDLKKVTSTENGKDSDFQDLMETKTEELATLHDNIRKQEKRKAEADVELAEATQSYDDTNEQMDADVKFFDETKTNCIKNNGLWEDRKALRQTEITGIRKALEILTSDESRKMFSKSFNSAASFVQTSMLEVSPAVQHAYDAIKVQAAKWKSTRLAQLAVEVRSATEGRFTAVIKAIDDVIQTLKDEGAEDIAKRDECKTEYQDIASRVNELNWKIEKNDAKINKLENIISDKTTLKEETIKKIGDTLEEIKAMEDTRTQENDDYKEAKQDDENGIELLKNAKDALSKFYDENTFLQEPEFDVSEDQAPDFQLSDKGNRKQQSKGIIGLMTILIEDLETEVKNGQESEDASQSAFEDSLEAAKGVLQALKDKKTNLIQQIAGHDSSKTDEEDDKKSNNQDLDDRNAYKADIKPDCDFVTTTFTARANRRAAEMNGLVEAKAFLSGAKRSSFLGAVNHHAN